MVAGFCNNIIQYYATPNESTYDHQLSSIRNQSCHLGEIPRYSSETRFLTLIIEHDHDMDILDGHLHGHRCFFGVHWYSPWGN